MDEESGDPLLCFAGKLGIVKIINCTTGKSYGTLQGHGNAINQLRVHPHEQRLLLTASRDESLRLWNIESGICIAVFAGDQGHRDEVLCADIHPMANCFISAGMDNSLKIWALDTESVQSAIARSFEHEGPASSFKTVFEQFPAFSTRKVHDNYIDYVEWVGNLIISKSISNKLVMWCPDVRREKDAVTVIREFTFEKCNVWFVRAALDDARELLSVGNTAGKLYVWSVDAFGSLGPTSCFKPTALNLSAYADIGTIRQTAFNADASILLAVSDNSKVWRCDRITSASQPPRILPAKA